MSQPTTPMPLAERERMAADTGEDVFALIRGLPTKDQWAEIERQAAAAHCLPYVLKLERDTEDITKAYEGVYRDRKDLLYIFSTDAYPMQLSEAVMRQGNAEGRRKEVEAENETLRGRLSELESQLELAHEQHMVWQNLWADASDGLLNSDNPDSLLERARLAVTRATLEQHGKVLHPAGVWTEGLEANRGQLQQDYFAMKQRAEKAENEAAAARQELAEQAERHKVEVLDILRDLRLPMLPVPDFNRHSPDSRLQEVAGLTGQNKERQAINDYCRQKAYEYDPQGIGPDPTKPGQWDTRPAAPTLVGDASPAPAVEVPKLDFSNVLPTAPALPTPKSRCENCGLTSLDTCPNGCLFGTGGTCPQCGKYLSYKPIAASPVVVKGGQGA